MITWCLLVLSVLCYRSGAALDDNIEAKTKEYEMMKLCGMTVDMATENIYAAYVSFEGYSIPINCTLVFQSGIWNESGWDSISIFFKDFEIQDDYCLIVSAISNSSTDLLGEYCIYANLTYSIFHVTNGGMLRLQFNNQNNELFDYEINFEFVVTVFDTEYDNCSEHVCDNKRCIPNELQCRGYNACGDWSDCPFDEALGFVMSVVFVTLMLMAICSICACKRYCCGENNGCCSCKEVKTEGVIISRLGTRATERQFVSTPRNQMSTAESIEIFPDCWGDNSLNEDITLEHFYNPRDRSYRNVSRGQNENMRPFGTSHRYTLYTAPLVANVASGACGTPTQGTLDTEETFSFREETPPPSYDEVLAQVQVEAACRQNNL